ncbi:MAG: hypothetical protein ACK417_12290 [Bacteroidia bacterium]
MAFQQIIRIGLVLLVGLSAACQRPLYFASEEVHPITRLDSAGDFQLSGLANLDMGYLQTYKAAAELAISRNLALRGSITRGGHDYLPGNMPLGRVRSHHLGLGSFYKLGDGYKGATWLGYSQGMVTNEHVLVTSFIFVPRALKINLHNNYSRLFIEQQMRYEFGGMEVFGVLSFGSSRVYNIDFVYNDRLENTLQAEQISRHQARPNCFYGALALGVSGGTENLRLFARSDMFFGDAVDQLGRNPALFLSTGISWRL